MEKKEVYLPICVPKFSTYNYLAAAGIVGQQHPQCEEWYVSNCIQVQCSKFVESQELNLTIHIGQIFDMPFLDIIEHRQSYVLNNLFDYIRNSINNGYYLYFTNADDFFIKNKSYYNNSHFHHDGLITGFNDIDYTYCISAYNSNFVFSNFICDQLSFAEGYNYGYRMSYETGRIPNMYEVKPNLNIVLPELDRNKIKHELLLYANPSLSNELIEDEHTAFGINVYKEIQSYLNYLINLDNKTKIIDKRLFRLLFEHKKNVGDAISIVTSGIPSKELLCDEYKQIIRTFQSWHLHYAKVIRTGNMKQLSIIIEALPSIIEKEISVINKIAN